ncbi:MAG: DUF1080 domain-containing protein [Armatimonadetes bacterium]|nr:DUF1080 domain-containing protein [Armatimonadota bacterium]
MTSRMARWAALALLVTAAACWADTITLFNGKDLTGWKGDGFAVADGALSSKSGAIYTDKAFGNLTLAAEFKLAAGASGGVVVRGARAQLVDPASFAFIEPNMALGALRGIAPAKATTLKPAGQWNKLDIDVAEGRARIAINGEIACEAALPAAPAQGPLGLVVTAGGIDFRGLTAVELGADAKMPPSAVDLNKAQPGDNTPPAGFVALFNGKDLDNWKGLVADPPKRAAMTAEQLATAQAAATQRAKEHWKVIDGVIVFDGKGDSLCTGKDYGDFEMYVDWKILPRGDSGIYLRGSPQVQIWDPAQWPVGSGALYNNQKNPKDPLLCADNPIGQWNTFRIKMIGEKVSVWLNGKLVTDNVTMENYWERGKPIYPTGQIELQNHGNTLWFKNIYIREITDPTKEK